MNLRNIAMPLLAVTATVGAAEPAAKQTLTFAWPEMTCAVKQKLESGNSPKPIESRYTLSSSRTGENLRVSFMKFEVIDTFQEVPARARAEFLEAESSLGRKTVERVFDVTAKGKFLAGETPEDVEKRMQTHGKVSPIFLMAIGDQEVIDARYRLGWQDFIGNWIGFTYSSGETTPTKIEHTGDEYWLTYDVPTEVTVTGPVDCQRGGKTFRCVAIRTHFVPAYNKPNDSDRNSTRHEDVSEIVLETDTMIPHSWMDETRYRGGSLNGNLDRRYTRRFDCTSGS